MRITTSIYKIAYNKYHTLFEFLLFFIITIFVSFIIYLIIVIGAPVG